MLILTILLFILIFGLIIFLHELGHFLVAKREGMTVQEFAFGFPPRIASFTKGGTRFSINLLPLGGFVSILGEDDPSAAKGSFTKFSAWARLRVVLAGIVMNLLLAWLLLTIWLWLAPLSPAVDAIAVASVQPGTPAEHIGIKVNDFIVSADGVTFHSDTALRDFTRSHQNQSVQFTVRRHGRNVILPAQLGSGDAPLGVSIVDIGKQVPHVPWYRAPWEALVEIGGAAWATVAFIGGLFARLFGVGGHEVSVDSVSGPVGIFSFLQQTVTLGAPFVIRFAGLISLAVGVFNLLPFPALDGGRAAFILFEGLFGKRALSHQAEAWIHAVGFAALILMIVVITYFDLKKL